jgi:hypothetical protein
MSKFWIKTMFWENVKKTFAILGAPATAGLHMLEAADGWVIFAGLFSFFGALLAIWITDNDKDGIVDLFQ